MFVSRARLVRWRRLAHGHDGLHGEARSAESGDSLRTLEGHHYGVMSAAFWGRTGGGQGSIGGEGGREESADSKTDSN